MRHTQLAILAVSAFAATGTHAGPTWKYVIDDVQVVDLGTFGGAESVANDINDHGEIVGWANLKSGAQHAFLWRNGEMEDLTPIPGHICEARGINNLTQVVGYVRFEDNVTPRAFHWDARSSLSLLDDAYTDPEKIESCASGANAKAINDSGVITGVRLGGCNPPVAHAEHAARWLSRTAPWQSVIKLDHPAKQNFAYDINSAGAIVGWNKDGASWTGAFRWWGPGSWDEVPFPSVPPSVWVVGTTLKGFGVNDNHAVVGVASLKYEDGLSEQRAIYWNGYAAESTLLPRLADRYDTAAYEINNQSFSVGYSYDRYKWAVIWHAQIGVRGLTMPPGAGSALSPLDKRCEALALNNRNAAGLIQAVGYCFVGGNRHAMLWNIATSKVITP